MSKPYAGAGWGDVPSSDPAERAGRTIKSQVPKTGAVKPDDGRTYDNTAGSRKVAGFTVSGNGPGAQNTGDLQ